MHHGPCLFKTRCFPVAARTPRDQCPRCADIYTLPLSLPLQSLQRPEQHIPYSILQFLFPTIYNKVALLQNSPVFLSPAIEAKMVCDVGYCSYIQIRYYQKMGDKNAELDFGKIQTCFQVANVSEKDYLNQQELLAALEKISQAPFDAETFQELWDQCKLNSKGEAKTADFIDNLLKAEQILLDKIGALESKIVQLELMKKPTLNDYSQQKKYKEDLLVLRQQKREIKLSLSIIRQPFQQFHKIKELLLVKEVASKLPEGYQKQKEEEQPENQLFEYDVTKTAETLVKIMYITLFLLAISCLSSFTFNRFLDMTLCLTIFISYACHTISRKIIKFNVLLLTTSFVVKLIWLILYVNNLWNPAHNYDFPVMSGAYLKISLSFVFLSQVTVLVLIYYFLTQMHINEMEVYTITLGSKFIYMQSGSNLQGTAKDPLGTALEHVFNPNVPPESRQEEQQ